MKKVILKSFIVFVIFTCLFMTACSNSTFDMLRDEIIDHGVSLVENCYSIELDSDVTLYYFSDSKLCSVSIYESNDGRLYDFDLYIDKQSVNICEYSWRFDYTAKGGKTYTVGGRLMAKDVTSNSISRGFIEDRSKRSSNLNSSLADSLTQQMVKVAEKNCSIALLEFKDYLTTNTNLKPSDFGFNL